MWLFNPPSRRQLDIGLGILRLAIGAVFIAHGAQKLFVFGLPGVIGSFGEMGIPAAVVLAPAVALLEFAGGIALVLGALTRLVALGLAFDMLVAMLLVHAPNGFFLPGGIEFTLALLGASALLTLTGGGSWSVDATFAARTPVAVSEEGHERVRRVA